MQDVRLASAHAVITLFEQHEPIVDDVNTSAVRLERGIGLYPRLDGGSTPRCVETASGMRDGGRHVHDDIADAREGGVRRPSVDTGIE